MAWTWDWPEAPGSGIRRIDTVAFYRPAEPYGGMSNMSQAYPMLVNGLKVRSNEALYQACRFPHRPDWQAGILRAPNGMRAKMTAKKEGRRRYQSRTDWDDVRVDLMRWCRQAKLAQHWESFGRLLLSTGSSALVEHSSRDTFWGAKPVKGEPGVLRGANVLLMGEQITRIDARPDPGLGAATGEGTRRVA